MIDIAKEIRKERRQALRCSTCKSRLDAVIPAALSVYGLVQIDGSRRRMQVMARTALAHLLHEDGFTLEEIGAALGKNHATLIHNEKRLSYFLGHFPGDEECQLYRRLAEAYNPVI